MISQPSRVVTEVAGDVAIPIHRINLQEACRGIWADNGNIQVDQVGVMLRVCSLYAVRRMADGTGDAPLDYVTAVVFEDHIGRSIQQTGDVVTLVAERERTIQRISAAWRHHERGHSAPRMGAGWFIA